MVQLGWSGRLGPVEAHELTNYKFDAYALIDVFVESTICSVVVGHMLYSRWILPVMEYAYD